MVPSFQFRYASMLILSLIAVSSCKKEADVAVIPTGTTGTANTAQVTTDSIAKGASATKLPAGIQLSADGRRLTTYFSPTGTIYDFESVKRIELTIPQANWQQVMATNYRSETEIPVKLVYDGKALPNNVGIRYKGNTSYSRNSSEKKSFNISTDFENADQELNGFSNLNLNCAFEDNTFMREVLYGHNNQKYMPEGAVNYVDLYINGQSWGIYINVQQLDGAFLKKWFLSNNGTRWRAEASGGTGGGGFGSGASALNYLGATESGYTPYYALKKANKDNPWADLVNTANVLNNTPAATLESKITSVLDLDRTLWFLASEIIYTDDDSYVRKGGMDYYLYWELETGRMTPLQYDGNSTFLSQYTTSMGPFYNADNTKFPLLNKLLAVPAIRQRYLAHFRTILKETFNPEYMNAKISQYAAKIDPYIQADPKKMMTYNQFTAGVSSLKTLISSRYNYLMANSEVNVTGLTISDVQYSAQGTAWQEPVSADAVTISSRISGGTASAVYAYCGTGIVGNFGRVKLFDDGTHGDAKANDGTYSVKIPAQASGTRMRFYIEAIKADNAGTRTYFPTGADHDVFTYLVK